jgi:predicted RNA binding protein YcfA (HicA-like mRNA interferase family)
MRRSLRNVRQREAVRAFVRLGGIERRGKGSHRVVNINRMNLSIPHGVLKEGLLRRLIQLAGFTVEDFLREL